MNKRINFDDNIFILTQRIRIIRDLLALDADPDLFLEKTIEDVDFIDTTLEILLDNLVKNDRFIEREFQYENLSEMEWQFSQVLRELLNGSGNISVANFPMIREKIGIMEQHSGNRNKIIENSRGQTDKTPMESVVSSDELNELLKN
ncbi:MAG: hypothetical protein LBP43_01105 [Treponema sp.]|jgi:flagellar biosynthesis component FlhA|nr:hypothetical protein [Treponema sp.]